MDNPLWLLMAGLVLLSWGALGVFQKYAMNYITAESAMVWAALGFMLLQPFLVPSGSIFDYSHKSLGWALLNGVFNGLGFLALMAAMRHGGKASIVEPLSAMYPMFVVVLAPLLLHESVRPMHVLGIACATIAGVLLAAETHHEDKKQSPSHQDSCAESSGQAI